MNMFGIPLTVSKADHLKRLTDWMIQMLLLVAEDKDGPICPEEKNQIIWEFMT